MVFLKIASILSICSIVGCHELEQSCSFHFDQKTYSCERITDTFPTLYQDGSILKCTDCHIPIFGVGTFPVQAKLTSFDVSNSGIQSIASGAFSVLPFVAYLYLGQNKIYDIEPYAFRDLIYLNELHLEHNELIELTPKFLGGIVAKNADLSHNHINQIPSNVFEGVFEILALNLSHNNIGILYEESFKGLNNLQTLDLQHNNLCYIPLGSFSHVQNIRDLNLSGNKLRTFILGTLSGLKKLETLNLAKNDLIEFDSSVFLSTGTLYNLDISWNNLLYLDFISLHRNVPTLNSFTINNNLWSCDVLKNMIQFLKSKHIYISETADVRYDVTNINGIICSMGPMNSIIPFNQFVDIVKDYTNKSINYC